MKRALACAVAAVALTGCGGGSDENGQADPEPSATTSIAPETTEIKAIVVTINPESLGVENSSCSDLPGSYAAVREGATLTLRDSTDEVVGTSQLEEGFALKQFCNFSATFTDVEEGGKFYTAELGKWKSDPQSEADLVGKQIVVDATK